MRTKNFSIIFILLLFTLKVSLAQLNPDELKDKIVLILDIQTHFTNSLSVENNPDKLIENINYVIVNSNPENVIYVRSIARVLNLTLKRIYVDTLPNMELDHRLKKVNEIVFDKTKPDAFTSANLIEYIKNKKINNIVIVGLLAEHCIFETAKEGEKRGYNIFIIPNAIAGKTKKSKNKKLNKLRMKGVEEIKIN